MHLTDLEQIFGLLENRPRQHLIAAWPVDLHSIEAAGKAVDMNLFDATLVGDKKVIIKLCKDLNIDPGKFNIVHESTDISSVQKSVDLINTEKGNLLMKGNLSTDKYMRAILNKESGLMDKGAVLSHVTVMKVPSYHKLLIIGDVAIIPQPDLKQKIAIVNYLIKTAHALGIDQPKLSVLAATEQVLPVMPACVDAAILSKMAERGQIRGALIDGPLSLDLTINKHSVKLKGITSQVAGDADCILFPNIESGNVFYKTSAQLGNGEQAAILVGARVPAVLSSRGDSARTKLYSLALAAMLAK
ncbi:MAG: bifunctional enoyl-CoA hydratase/phosphate acetyltransferase [Bacteroidales bacterium]